MKGGLSCSDLQSGAVVAPTAEDMRGGKARHVGIIAGGGRIADAARRLSRGDSMAVANGLSSLSTTAMERIYACRPSSRWLQHREVMQSERADSQSLPGWVHLGSSKKTSVDRDDVWLSLVRSEVVSFWQEGFKSAEPASAPSASRVLSNTRPVR